MLKSKTEKSYKNVSFYNGNREKFATADCIDCIHERHYIGAVNCLNNVAYHSCVIIAFDIKIDDRCAFPTGKAVVIVKDQGGNEICNGEFNVNFNRRDMNVVFSSNPIFVTNTA